VVNPMEEAPNIDALQRLKVLIDFSTPILVASAREATPATA
jgi:hypothetical protein